LQLFAEYTADGHQNPVLMNAVAFVNDMTSGLTSHIKARIKQYENYRDRLLTI